jgi:hypothetical protein
VSSLLFTTLLLLLQQQHGLNKCHSIHLPPITRSNQSMWLWLYYHYGCISIHAAAVLEDKNKSKNQIIGGMA